MKNVFLSVAVLLCSLFQACSDSLSENTLGDVELQTRSSTFDKNAEVSTINHNGENMLRFRDMEAYENVLKLLNSKNNEERIAYTNSLQVKTISALLAESDKELDEICESSTIETFRPKYEQFKHKYKNIFMFNDVDSEDLSAYSKLRNPMDDNIANEDGEYMIGDSLVQSSEFNNFSEFYSNSIVTYANETSNPNVDINHAWSHWDKRKVGCYLSFSKINDPGYIGITMRLTAQKKFIFGWKRYSTMYHARFNLTGSGGFEFYETAYYGFPVEKYVNMNNKEFTIHTKELDGNFSVLFGRVSYTEGGALLYHCSCSGQMEVWSRGIEEEHRGIAKVDLKY